MGGWVYQCTVCVGGTEAVRGRAQLVLKSDLSAGLS